MSTGRDPGTAGVKCGTLPGPPAHPPMYPTHLLKDALALEASEAGLPQGWGQALSTLTGGQALEVTVTLWRHTFQ